jgi:hypothetical protein
MGRFWKVIRIAGNGKLVNDLQLARIPDPRFDIRMDADARVDCATRASEPPVKRAAEP